MQTKKSIVQKFECNLRLNPFAVETLYDTPSWFIHGMTLLMSVGYGIYHTSNGILSIGVFAFCSALACIFSIYCLIKHTPKPIFYYAIYVCQFFALVITSYYFGVRGLMLTAPFVSGAFFLFPFNCALLISCTFVVTVLFVSFHTIEIITYIRMSLAIFFTLFFIITFTHVIYKQQEKSDHEAHHDLLTDILNRRGFLKKLQEHLDKAKKDNTNLVLFYFDIDQFKSVNDTFGHAIGDAILVAFAKRILGVIRIKELYVEKQHITDFGRLSGDEFVLSISNIDSIGAAQRIADRILNTVNAPFRINNHVIHSTVSVGICFARDVGYNMSTLGMLATICLHYCKALITLCIDQKIRIETVILSRPLLNTINHRIFITNYLMERIQL